MLVKPKREEVISTVNQNIYGSSSPFTTTVHLLGLNPDINPYILRVLPANCDPRFGEPTSNFAIFAPQHEGLGRDGKEKTLCPGRLSTSKAHVICPCCSEYSHDNPTKRSKMKPYMYINVVLLSNHVDSKGNPIKNIDEATGQYIIYTLRITKSQIFDELGKHFQRTNTKVPDFTDLTYGCAVSLKVFKKGEYWNYGVYIDENAVGDLLALNDKGLPYINVDAIPDLRSIVEWIPTEEAVSAMMNGMSVKDAVEIGGKINTFTGEKKGGSTGITPAATNARPATPINTAASAPAVNTSAGIGAPPPPPAASVRPPMPSTPPPPPAASAARPTASAPQMPPAPAVVPPPQSSDVEFINEGDEDESLSLP